MTLTKKQLRTLNEIRALTRAGERVTASKVAEATGVTKSSAQAMMWHLADLGMLRRPTVVVMGKWLVSGRGNEELNLATSIY